MDEDIFGEENYDIVKGEKFDGIRELRYGLSRDGYIELEDELHLVRLRNRYSIDEYHEDQNKVD